MKKGIVDNMESCLICGSPEVEIHHCIHGTANRAKAEKYKLVVPLCGYHHRGWERAPHRCKDMDDYFKRMAQTYFELNIGSREMFMKEFGKNFL